MLLEKIILTNFKSYDFYELKLQSGVNCITGINGIGKTNLLDAIYYICLCKSAFAGADKLLIREGQDFFRVQAHFQTDMVVAKYQHRKKVFELNKKPYSRLFEHIGQFPVVLAAPEDAKLITGGSTDRRKFIDSCLAQTNKTYLENLMQYNRILRQRNAALKKMLDEKSSNPALIEALDIQLVPLAVTIQQTRQSFIASFSPVFHAFYQKISNGREEATMTYHSNFEPTTLQNDLKHDFMQDYYAGRTKRGIHKDNLSFQLNNFEVKDFASQGQSKSVLLAMRLAQYQWIRQQTNKTPLFLIDDIYDKLDQHRVHQLLCLLEELQIPQIILTDTSADRLIPLLEKTKANYHFLRLDS